MNYLSQDSIFLALNSSALSVQGEPLYHNSWLISYRKSEEAKGHFHGMGQVQKHQVGPNKIENAVELLTLGSHQNDSGHPEQALIAAGVVW